MRHLKTARSLRARPSTLRRRIREKDAQINDLREDSDTARAKIAELERENARLRNYRASMLLEIENGHGDYLIHKMLDQIAESMADTVLQNNPPDRIRSVANMACKAFVDSLYDRHHVDSVKDSIRFYVEKVLDSDSLRLEVQVRELRVRLNRNLEDLGRSHGRYVRHPGPILPRVAQFPDVSLYENGTDAIEEIMQPHAKFPIAG